MDFSRFIRGYTLSYSVSGSIRLHILADQSQTIATAMLFRPISQPALPGQP
jgi:hypothetical protein